MRKLLFVIIAFVALSITSCNTRSTNKVQQNDSTTVDSVQTDSATVDSVDSTVCPD